MPLITIRSARSYDNEAIQEMLQAIRKAGADALDCATENIWVRFEAIPASWYAQSDDPTQNSPLVTIQAKAGRTPQQPDLLTRATAEAVGQGLSVHPSQVWIHYLEMNPQDIWYEGRWSK
jgi:phenylpyruvate tautomerase PptA (4-oxalocrotonate tautomerase family)